MGVRLTPETKDRGIDIKLRENGKHRYKRKNLINNRAYTFIFETDGLVKN